MPEMLSLSSIIVGRVKEIVALNRQSLSEWYLVSFVGHIAPEAQMVDNCLPSNAGISGTLTKIPRKFPWQFLKEKNLKNAKQKNNYL